MQVDLRVTIHLKLDAIHYEFLYFSNKAKKMRLVVEYLRDNHDRVFKDCTCVLLLGPFPHLHRCCGPRVGHQGLTLHDQRHAAWREIQLCPQDWQGGQSREDGTGNLTRLRCQRESVVRKICICITQRVELVFTNKTYVISDFRFFGLICP